MGESATQRDLRKAAGLVRQQYLGPLDAEVQEILIRRYADGALEHPQEIIRAGAASAGHRIEPDIGIDVLSDEFGNAAKLRCREPVGAAGARYGRPVESEVRATAGQRLGGRRDAQRR